MPEGLLSLLHRANQIATERFALTVNDTDLTARQVQILAAIEANEGASQSKIVESTGVDRSTIADIIRRLENRGAIARQRTKEDARAYAVVITDAGRRELAHGKPALANVEEVLMSTLSANQRTELVALLGQVVFANNPSADPKRRHR